MASFWYRLPRAQRRAWTMVAGALTVGTIVKIAYFRFSRGLIVSDSKRQQEEARQHLQEAHEFAKWSKQDRQARVPKVSEEQRNQIKEYLQLVEQHSVNKLSNPKDGNGANCEGCPIMGHIRNAIQPKTE